MSSCLTEPGSSVQSTERPLPQLPEEAVRTLYDGTKRISYALAMDIVDLVRSDPDLHPQLRRAGHARLTRHPIPVDDIDRLWHRLLDGPVNELAASLLGLDDHGELLRDTMPFAGVIPEPRRMAIARRARHDHLHDHK